MFDKSPEPLLYDNVVLFKSCCSDSRYETIRLFSVASDTFACMQMCHFKPQCVIASGEETYCEQTPLHSSCAGRRPWRPCHISRPCQTINCNHASQLNYLARREPPDCIALQTFLRYSAVSSSARGGKPKSGRRPA